MTGTQNHEGLAGTVAAIEHIAALGAEGSSGRERLVSAFEAIGEYENGLCRRLVEGLKTIPEVRVWGIVEPDRFDQRVPTLSITHERVKPADIARTLVENGIFVWDGNYYAVPLSEAIGLEPDGSVRIGLLHYNTEVEVDRLLEKIAAL